MTITLSIQTSAAPLSNLSELTYKGLVLVPTDPAAIDGPERDLCEEPKAAYALMHTLIKVLKLNPDAVHISATFSPQRPSDVEDHWTEVVFQDFDSSPTGIAVQLTGAGWDGFNHNVTVWPNDLGNGGKLEDAAGIFRIAESTADYWRGRNDLGPEFPVMAFIEHRASSDVLSIEVQPTR